jgi:hypothetical protein
MLEKSTSLVTTNLVVVETHAGLTRARGRLTALKFAVMKELGIKDAFAFDRHFETAGFRRLPK